MSDQTPPPLPPQSTDGILDAGPSNCQLIYILYLASFFLGITAIIGVVLAYINRGRGGAMLDSHYTWAIRTFWIGLLGGIVSAVLMLILIGFLTALLVAIWFIVRCVIGLQKVSRGEPIANPESWML